MSPVDANKFIALAEVVVALATPTVAEQSPYHASLSLSKCLPNHKRVTGPRAPLASTTAGARCEPAGEPARGGIVGPAVLIKMAMTPQGHTHEHTQCVELLSAFESLRLCKDPPYRCLSEVHSRISFEKI